MFRSRMVARTVALFTALSSGQALAAQVNPLDGPISINRGSGYGAVGAPTSAGTGDRIMAGQGGKAEIIYENGCRVVVEAGSVVTITDPPPCAPGADAGTNTAQYALGAAVVVGAGVGLAILLSNNSNKKDEAPAAAPAASP